MNVDCTYPGCGLAIVAAKQGMNLQVHVVIHFVGGELDKICGFRACYSHVHFLVSLIHCLLGANGGGTSL